MKCNIKYNLQLYVNVYRKWQKIIWIQSIGLFRYQSEDYQVRTLTCARLTAPESGWHCAGHPGLKTTLTGRLKSSLLDLRAKSLNWKPPAAPSSTRATWNWPHTSSGAEALDGQNTPNDWGRGRRES